MTFHSNQISNYEKDKYIDNYLRRLHSGLLGVNMGVTGSIIQRQVNTVVSRVAVRLDGVSQSMMNYHMSMIHRQTLRRLLFIQCSSKADKIDIVNLLRMTISHIESEILDSGKKPIKARKQK